MNYILFYKGKLPSYTDYCINSILSIDKDSKIYFLIDSKVDFHNDRVIVVNLLSINSIYIEKLNDLNYFAGDNNPLWESSLMRIFYINEFINMKEINEFVHFDLDVLIYKSFKEVQNIFLNNKINITPLTKNFLVFGYCYIPTLQLFTKLTDMLFKILENKKFYEEKYYNSQRLNEMKMLYIAYDEKPELFNLLNVLPNDKSSFLFDPGSYGQYLGGTHKKKFSKGFIDKDHIAGIEISKKNVKPILFKNNYCVKENDRIFDLVNLHVHSKKLKNFLPQNYSKLVKTSKL